MPIATGTAILGSAAIGGLASIFGGISANKAQASESSLNRAWQEKMSNTAYQRSMKDMRTAGLNPILAYSQGGATSPPGNMARFENVGEKAVQSAVGAASAASAVKTERSARSKMSQEEKTLETQQGVNKASEARIRQDQATSAMAMMKLEQETLLLNAQVPGAQAEMFIDESRYGKALRWINRATNSGWGVLRGITGKKTGDR